MLERIVKKCGLWMLLLSSLLLISSCGGGDTDSATGGQVGNKNFLSGTAATGSPLVGAQVTIRDQFGNTATATTDGNGKYQVDVSSLLAPFLGKVESGGQTFYSLASQSSQAGVMNFHPLTHLAVASYYRSFNEDVGTVFNNLNTASRLPGIRDQEELRKKLNRILKKWLLENSLNPVSFDCFATSFDANSTGFDKILDGVNLTDSGTSFTLNIADSTNASAPTQTSILTFDASNIPGFWKGSHKVEDNASQLIASWEFETRFADKTDDELVDILDKISTRLESIKNIINQEGNQLEDSHIQPFLMQAFLHNILDRSSWAAFLVDQTRGQNLRSISMNYVSSQDTNSDNVLDTVTLNLEVNRDDGNQNPVSLLEIRNMVFKKDEQDDDNDGDTTEWLFFGNQQKIKISLPNYSERINGGSCTRAFAVAIEALQGEVTSAEIVRVTGTGPFATQSQLTGPTGRTIVYENKPGQSTNIQVDGFSLTQSVTSFPETGSKYSLTVNFSSGSSNSFTLFTGPRYQDCYVLNQPTSFSLSQHQGTTMNVQWKAPTGFPLHRVHVRGDITTTDASNNTTTHTDSLDPLSEIDPGETSANFNIPNQFNGENVTVVRIEIFFLKGSEGYREASSKLIIDLQ